MALSKIFGAIGESAGALAKRVKKSSSTIKLGSGAVADAGATAVKKPSVASNIAKAFPTKFATKALGGTAVVVGATGIAKVGFDWTQDMRGLFGLTTPKEDIDSILDQRARANDLTADQINMEKDYLNFLKDNGLNDNPDMRNLFDEKFGGSVSGDTEPQTGNGFLQVALVGGAIVGALILANNLSKKKGTVKK